MQLALAEHDRSIADAVDANRGRVFSHMGDGVAAAFASSPDALRAAIDIQRRLLADEHPDIGRLRVRIGIHSGEAEERGGDFFGPTVNRAARIMAVAHGGQILVSGVAARLADSEEFDLTDLGDHRLRDLGRAERIHQLGGPGLPSEFPPLSTLTDAPNNLPTQLTSFVGRTAELAQVIDLLGASRMVTLTGVGGVGKTRVALQAAADLAPEYPDGTWLVALAPVSDPKGVDAAFLDALGVPQTDMDPRDAFLDHLRTRSVLLVVDNCEHLIDASADAVAAILSASQESRVLATSRELLGVPGEAALGLRSMSLPGEREAWQDSDAVRLLLERARQAKPGFRADGHEEALAEMCRRLDGIPLALELAAARLRSFSPERVAGLLDESFRLLTGGSRTAVPRQRTLEATIEWSHRLLDEAEQQLFRKLSVFSGGFTVESVAAVVADDHLDDLDVLELISALVDKSLVAADDGEVERFHLLETIRQYASARLEAAGDVDALRRRHAEHFRDLLAEAAELRWGPEGPTVLRQMRVERDNLRQALTWALEAREGAIALDLATGFGRFSEVGRWSEPVMWYERALEVAGDPADEIDRAVRLVRLASMVGGGPDTDRAVRLGEEAISIFERNDDPPNDAPWLFEYAAALLNLAVVKFYRGEGGERNEHFRPLVFRALEIARRVDHRPLIAACLGNLAHHVDPEADPAEVRALFDEAEAAARDADDTLGLPTLSWQRARYEFFAGDLETSLVHWGTAIDRARDAGFDEVVARFQVGAALAELEAGDASAVERMDVAIRDVLAASDSLHGATASGQVMLVGRATADLRLGRPARAAVAIGASDAESARGVPVPWDLAPHLDRVAEGAREALTDDAFEDHLARGKALSRDEIMAFLGERP